MPELPEVEALAAMLRHRAVDEVVSRVDPLTFSVLKTYEPPLSQLQDERVTDVQRHGKFLDISTARLHLVVHLARAGWLRWRDELPVSPPRPGKSPQALRFRLANGSGFDLTEAGTTKRLAVYLVRQTAQVPGIATLGIDPLDESFDAARLATLLAGQRHQLKGLLRDQKVIAGIGNAYSDEILHVARMSPFTLADKLTDEGIVQLHRAIVDTLREAATQAEGVAAGKLKAHKHTTMRVHGRAGGECPVCGDTIAQVNFADSTLEYCPHCQTSGKQLADRRMSKLLK